MSQQILNTKEETRNNFKYIRIIINVNALNCPIKSQRLKYWIKGNIHTHTFENVEN